MLVEALRQNPGVMNLVVLPDAARDPDGDAVQFDVITAESNRVLDELRKLEIDRRGSIMIDTVDTVISAVATRQEQGEPARSDLSPIWEQVDARMRDLGRYPPSWFTLLIIAGLLAAVGILTNSEILIVGAMIVGPEYAAIAGVVLGINTKERSRVERGLLALVVGFVLAIVAAFLFGLLVRGFDLEPKLFTLGIRPVSDLINTPNFFSVVVAVLAGVVGMVSLTESRASTLIGVFVSVTTIPAAADIGVSMAFSSWHQAWGSAVQLLLNLVLLIVVGALTLNIQRRFWSRVDQRQHARALRGALAHGAQSEEQRPI
jgi:uncharacterized hydrophobic protein (TIGR00271 family)